MARKPTRFSTEREAVDGLHRFHTVRTMLRDARAEVRKLEAEDEDLTAAYLAFLSANDLSSLADAERNIHLERGEKAKARQLDAPNVPDDLLPWLAQVGGIVGRVGVIDKLPDSENKDRVKRYIAPGGTTDQLTFTEEETA